MKLDVLISNGDQINLSWPTIRGLKAEVKTDDFNKVDSEPLHPAFTVNGFNSWKRVNNGAKCVFLAHMGGPTSPHNNAVRNVEALKNISRHIDKVMNVQSLENVKKNRLCLKTTIDSVRWLTLQGCALRGHDESLTSKNRGNLVELISLLGKLNVEIDDVVLEKAPGNAKYTSHLIQKDILHILSTKVRNKIREEVGNARFCIDEAKDVSNREQMAIILRFVDIHGYLQERFFEIVHVEDTCALTLKNQMSQVLTRHNLHIKDLRGQGYDGASNMRGAWNGLQALFRSDCEYAYYVHCFAHRLQLALVAAAEKEISVWLFFSKLTCIVNLVSASPKRHIELRSTQASEIECDIASGERETGKGANQIGTLHRAGTTRWSSHFDSICSLIDMYGATIIVLRSLVKEGATNKICGEAGGCLMSMKSFDFIFILHLMHKIMGISDMLCRTLQQKSLDILNAMNLVSTTKELLRTLREEGFDHLLGHVKSICLKFDIDIPDMSTRYKEATGCYCQQNDDITVQHHYCIDIFKATVDYILDELRIRFNEESMELLMLSSALDPRDNFKGFDHDRILLLAEKFYPADFSGQDIYLLKCQLDHY
ncbi:zinc finger MYM-type protein 1-like [Tripterygium wilfordii]|uniref:zinc finger MYM-type protein 1-like n=1 Tax=Tripterygium wilfordii TaxID=458696 RepID=UPI0018F8256E|nr:zinc finger MYM-type protein 1-like [Tripterygium wilfordii]